MSDHFCPVPFGHGMVDTRGFYHTCCLNYTPDLYAQNIRQVDYTHWQKNEYLDQVRQSFLRGEKHPGCNRCWITEERGEDSYRQRVLKEYKILGIDKTSRKIVNAEIQVGNLCNLSCMMCNEYASSALLAENKRLGISQLDQKTLTWDDAAWNNLQILLESPDLKVLNIRGGEPFYNKRFLESIEQMPIDRCRGIVLHLTTNGTVWNDRWKKALSRFKLVRLMFSLDGTGDLYEYIRYPASWTEVESNIIEMQSLPNVNAMVHCTVQNLNIHALNSLIDWCNKNQIYLEFEQLYNPPYLRLYNLPEHLKTRALESLQQARLTTLDSHIIKSITSYIKLLKDNEFDPSLWEEFIKKVSIRDQHRNRNFELFLPTRGAS